MTENKLEEQWKVSSTVQSSTLVSLTVYTLGAVKQNEELQDKIQEQEETYVGLPIHY